MVNARRQILPQAQFSPLKAFVIQGFFPDPPWHDIGKEPHTACGGVLCVPW